MKLAWEEALPYVAAGCAAAFLGWLSRASMSEFFILYTLHCILFKMRQKEG